MVERFSREVRVTEWHSLMQVVLMGSSLGGLLLCDAINLICADPLICLLFEPGHCRLVVAIVRGGGLKNFD